jgi:Ca2+-binding RTX toxin-like protein
MENLEDTFTVSVIGNGIGAVAGVIQDLIRDAHLQNPSIASGLALAKITVLAVGAEGFSVAIAVQSGDPDRIGKASTAAIGSIVLSTVGAIGVGALGLTGIAPALVVAGLGAAGTYLGKQIWEHYKESVTTGIAPPPNVVMPDGITDFDFWSIPGGVGPIQCINPNVNTKTTDALNWRPPRDPLVLDLDGDGIEAVGINPSAPILFDMDASGTKHGTGWIKADDGLVVLDRNGNGLIDSGRELFGDRTVLQNGPKAGQTAANGYEALADLDLNADGAINSTDAAYSQLRIWQDTNQNGISESTELHTLGELGIASINVSGTASKLDLGNGNTQPFTGSFTRINGSTGTSGVAEVSGSLLLANNNFYREFSDDPTVATGVQAMPQTRGSGMVRDLRQAMSLGTPEAATLQAKLNTYAAATTREAQLAALDELVMAWGKTSSMQTSIDVVTDPAYFHQNLGGNTYDPNSGPVYSAETTIQAFAKADPDLYAKWTALERFNGLRISSQLVGIRITSMTNGSVTGWEWCVNASAPQLKFLEDAYAELKDSVYGALVAQTRLKPYLDNIGLTIDEAGVHFDTSGIDSLLASVKSTDEKKALTDLIELNRYAQPTLQSVGYDGLGKLKSTIDALPSGSTLLNTLDELHVLSAGFTSGTAKADIWLGDASANSFNGGEGDDIAAGGAGADTLYGGAGNDALQGGADNDSLNGDAGNDTLDGGAGNDNLWGDAGADTYLFGQGSGQDTIYNYDSDALGVNADTLKLGAGIATTDVTLKRERDDLRLSLNGSTDSVLISNYFNTDGVSKYVVENIVFADGTNWDVATIKAKVVVGTAGNDTLTGYALADTLDGGDGNDYIYGNAGDDALMGGNGSDYLTGDDGVDTLQGGAGADTLYGGAGNDALQGGADNDSLNGDAGNDTLDGGAGNDNLWGDAGADTYLFGQGSGQDTIYNYDSDALGVNADTLKLGAGISADQLWFRQVSGSLEVSVIGTNDKFTVSNWYSGNAYHVDQFKTSDGKTLLDSQVQNLVSAMAGFAPPAAGETTLSAAYQTALTPVLAANWQ